MTRPIFVVEPQRQTSSGWLTVEPYKATSFAVVRTERYMRKRKTYITRTVISRCATRKEALDLCEANNKSFAPVQTYKLGRRINAPTN